MADTNVDMSAVAAAAAAGSGNVGEALIHEEAPIDSVPSAANGTKSLKFAKTSGAKRSSRKKKAAAGESAFFSEEFKHKLVELYGPFPELPEGGSLTWPRLLFWQIVDNWRSGLTVAMVSVPLSISLALAASATPVMGIITAMWAGLATALFGGSQYNIQGPTGALSGILSVYAFRYGVDVLPLLSLLAGIICLIVVLLRLDIYVMFIPSAVMEGFSLAVAVIIAGNQIGFAFGLSGLTRHEAFYENLFESLSHLGNMHGLTFAIFLVSTLALAGLVYLKPTIPWSVILAVFAILLGWLAEGNHLNDAWKKVGTLKSRYGDLTPDLFTVHPLHFPTPKPGETTMDSFWAAFYAAGSVAFVGVLETLISARIADRMTNTKFAQPREVFGTGIANILCGIFGGVPATAALARTALNIKSGATSRMSGVLSASGILIISLVLLPYFRYLLLPVIAAILVITAGRMIEFRQLWHMYLYDKTMFGIAMFTAAVCIIKDPTDGILFGGIISLFVYARANSRAYGEVDIAVSQAKRIVASKTTHQLDQESTKEAASRLTLAHSLARLRPLAKKTASKDAGQSEEDTLIYKFPGELTYLNSPAHADRIKSIAKKYSHVIFSMRFLYYIDLDGLDVLEDIVKELTLMGKLVLVSSASADINALLTHSAWFQKRIKEKQVVASEIEALRVIHQLVHAGDDGTDSDDRSDAVVIISSENEPHQDK